jgi:hypothetical protein
MAGISWLVYHYADSGEIYQVTGVPGNFPTDGAQVDIEGNEIVRHLMKDDLESLGFENPSQFMIENSWNGTGWTNRGTRPTVYYRWDNTAWVIDSQALNWQIRLDRGVKLSFSDWTQANDSPLSDEKKTEWRTYRQSLRDIMANLPADLDDPENVVWPTEPS